MKSFTLENACNGSIGTEQAYFCFWVRIMKCRVRIVIVSVVVGFILKYNPGLFFHRFFKITNKWISRILEFRKKSLSLGKKSLSLGGKFLSLGGEFSSFMWKLTIFALKLHKNCRIFEFGFKTCLSLEKILEFRKKS